MFDMALSVVDELNADAQLLSRDAIALSVEDEDSEALHLLSFCPIALSVASPVI